MSMTVDANTATGTHANAFVFTKSKNTYWNGLGFQSSHGHIGAIVGMRDAAGGDADQKIRIEIGGTGINASEEKTWDFLNNGNLSISDGNLVVASGHGIDFSAVSGSGSGSDSALLDDYEEGSWSPLWSDATSGGTRTSNNMHGRYTKVGKLVTAHFWTWGLPVQGTNNAMYLQGLPFASGTIGATFHPIGCAFFNMGADNYHNLGLRLANNVTYAPLLFCRKDPGDKIAATFGGFINYYTNFEGTITYLSLIHI